MGYMASLSPISSFDIIISQELHSVSIKTKKSRGKDFSMSP